MASAGVLFGAWRFKLTGSFFFNIILSGLKGGAFLSNVVILCRDIKGTFLCSICVPSLFAFHRPTSYAAM